MVCGFFSTSNIKSNGKFISAETGRLVLNFLLFCIQHSLWGIQHIIQSSVIHTRHLLCLFSMLAYNLQNYPGLILTNLKFATGHRINIVLKDRWIFNVIIGLKNLMWRKQFCYGPLYNIAQNSSPTTMYMQNGLYYGRTCSQTFYRYLKTEFKYPLHIRFNARFVYDSM